MFYRNKATLNSQEENNPSKPFLQSIFDSDPLLYAHYHYYLTVWYPVSCSVPLSYLIFKCGPLDYPGTLCIRNIVLEWDADGLSVSTLGKNPTLIMKEPGLQWGYFAGISEVP